MQSSLTNVHIAGEDLLRTLYKLFCLRFCVSSDPLTKNCVGKILQVIWKTFSYGNNRNYNSHKFSYKFAFIPFLSFRRNQKQDQVSSKLTRNIFDFCSQRVALCFKGTPNSTDFYQRIFLHLIPVRIIVPRIN